MRLSSYYVCQEASSMEKKDETHDVSSLLTIKQRTWGSQEASSAIQAQLY